MHVDAHNGKVFVAGKPAYSLAAVRRLCWANACARGIISTALGNVRADDTCRAAAHTAADHALPKG
eukprot:5179359-Pleurochrysis_carterae.AAC.1